MQQNIFNVHDTTSVHIPLSDFEHFSRDLWVLGLTLVFTVCVHPSAGDTFGVRYRYRRSGRSRHRRLTDYSDLRDPRTSPRS